MNENQYPTLRFLTCAKCGNTFVSSPDGSKECPECASESTVDYSPEMPPPANDAGKSG